MVVTELENGIQLRIQAQPGAKRNLILGEHNGRLKVAVTQKPENGKANQAIEELLAQHLGVPKSNCSIRSGHTNRLKCLVVLGISEREALRRLGLGDPND